MKPKNKTLTALAGKKVMITAGPTQESLDPVRYISNHSSGKMGYALAEVFVSAGARVTLISGPTSLSTPAGLERYVGIRSSDELYQQAKVCAETCDIAVFAAAVADYKPVRTEETKIKSTSETLQITLTKTVDTAGKLGTRKKKTQFYVGFALETENEIENAVAKRMTKNLDMIVLNSMRDEGAGFEHDTNRITIIDRDNKIYNFGLKMKTEVARDIVAIIAKKMTPDETD